MAERLADGQTDKKIDKEKTIIFSWVYIAQVFHNKWKKYEEDRQIDEKTYRETIRLKDWQHIRRSVYDTDLLE